MSWLSPQQTWRNILDELPVIGDKFQPFYDSFWHLPQLPAQTVELCRLRVAQLHQNSVEFDRSAIEIPAAQREALANWNRDEHFSAAERACLAFTEVYTMDVSAITDALADDVKTCLGDAGLVALVQALGLYYGRTRIAQLWQLTAN